MDLIALPDQITAAEARIRPFVRETYLEYSPLFSAELGAPAYFKLENLQHTGSFKVRGALNKLLLMDEATRERGVVTASTGNHGAAVGYALAQVGGRGIAYVPAGTSPVKLKRMAGWGLEVREHGEDGVEAERAARAYAASTGRVYISPYNDPDVIAGQGTIGVELARQLSTAEAVFVSVGGGGLISGIGAYLKTVWPDVRLIGCSPAQSAVMIRSLAAGRILDLPSRPTLSDGTAGGVEAGSVTFESCRALIDDTLIISEEEIAAALRAYILAENKLIEGAAAVALAGAFEMGGRFGDGPAVIVLCGGNIDPARLLPIFD